MALLVEYKCKQTNLSIYQFEHKYIKQVMNMKNKSMQDITQVRDRESNRKHGRFVSRFEHPCSTFRLQHYEGFSLKTIPPDH